MLTRTMLLTALLAALACSACGSGTSTPDAATTPIDGATFDAASDDEDASLVDAATVDDAATGTDASTADAGTDASAIDAGGPVTCDSLPPCVAQKGCGPTLTTACCCGDTVFDPATAIGCCCGYGIVPGAFLTCEG